MNEKTDDALLSQLVDGELDSDELNDVLAAVLDDADARRRLQAHLALRRGLADWRRQKPDTPILAAGEGRRRRFPVARRLAGLAAAMILGAALATAGFLAARPKREGPDVSVKPTTPPIVSIKQIDQINRAYKLYESVAGPLRWYADDDSKIQLDSAPASPEAGEPVAVVLRLSGAGSGAAASRNYVIVCRNNESATVELPDGPGKTSTLRIHLAPSPALKGIGLKYAIAVADDPANDSFPAMLAGERQVGLEPRPLGQLALADALVEVDASAWTIDGKQ
jgi:hypothetical protein